MNTARRTLISAAAGLGFGLMARPSNAQEDRAWPRKPVRVLLPAPPGAAIDFILRLLQPKLQALWSQPIVIENKPGAGGNIALQEVARASDDHTLFGGPDTIVTVNPALYKKLSFNPRQDIVPVTYLVAFNQVLVCHPRTGLRDLASLLEAARSRTLSYASSGAGGPSHMAMEMLLGATHTKMIHVPYRGPSPAALDVAGGQVDCAFLGSTSVWPFVKDGRLTALAVSGAKRSPQFPTVPTVGEGAVPGFDATFHETLQAPRGMSQAVIDKIQRDVAALLQAPESKAVLLDAGLLVVANTPAQAAQQGIADAAKWGRIAKAIQLTLD
ncbi:tripartite tricarboxylate transporter substrate-binding protein [Variovorax sp. RCC_210]|uniref:Bug family tripartite tricarboxylate transporter substrate binding protein n=1 Tax=Variovorax sp. RCC_210 TaxID=3239217 RepID=UPI000D5DA12F